MPVAKKLLLAITATLLVTIMSGCDSKEDTAQNFIQQTAASSQPEMHKTFRRQVGDLDIKITYHYKNDVVLSQTTEDTIPYRVLPAKNIMEAKGIMGKISDAYSKMSGVSQTVEYKHERAYENLNIDFTQANISKLCALKEISIGMIITDCSVKYLTMSGVEKFLQEQEFDEVK
jgi:uncharacterized lipoprotein YehR (DUF1307 family)